MVIKYFHKNAQHSSLSVKVILFSLNWRLLFHINKERSIPEAVVQGCSVKKALLKICKIHWKPPVSESLLIKVPTCGTTLLKKRLCHRCFPVNFRKLLRNNFFYRIPLVVAFCSHSNNDHFLLQGRIQNPVKHLRWSLLHK